MSRPPCPRALTVLARWLLGTMLVTWRYLWQTTPLHRTDVREEDERIRPPRLPGAAAGDTVQRAEDGHGPLFHRVFRVRIAEADIDGPRLLEHVCRHFEHFVPSEVVGIRAGELRAQGLDVADELLVEVPGPWNGPVRVVRRDRESLHLVTLRGHMEAGQVQFRAHTDGDLLVFEIELWARAATRLVHVLYSHLRVAKEIQLNMWVRFCLSAVKISGGRLVDGVHIHTRRLSPPPRAARKR
ncbi:DUF1990 family protein [Streptomyces sp. SID4946]|uniref:DUF1990 family protein n=1 Tax=Streptomyces sp. LamerLS-31b TaxID=1839765 RepID=UPI00081F0A97|nr:MULTISPECIES: DUF1990 family protein [unclassified Streptomyces]MYQ96621.1 DUF1990 family protein [Streptomyces sp. SID4946]SCF89670.1 protein of unknown function [Streptomyces sp. LamerLS-31b]SCG01344.1 protein of unknown function [Streptomyces sp. DconLS]